MFNGGVGMNRIDSCFDRLAKAGKKALIPFITAGDPSPDITLALMHAMVEAGADIIELGVPFSDPMADGPVIQLASERALAAGTTTQVVLDTVARFREQDNTTDRKSTRLNSSHVSISYAVFCLKKKI